MLNYQTICWLFEDALSARGSNESEKELFYRYYENNGTFSRFCQLLLEANVSWVSYLYMDTMRDNRITFVAADVQFRGMNPNWKVCLHFDEDGNLRVVEPMENEIAEIMDQEMLDSFSFNDADEEICKIAKVCWGCATDKDGFFNPYHIFAMPEGSFSRNVYNPKKIDSESTPILRDIVS